MSKEQILNFLLALQERLLSDPICPEDEEDDERNAYIYGYNDGVEEVVRSLREELER